MAKESPVEIVNGAQIISAVSCMIVVRQLNTKFEVSVIGTRAMDECDFDGIDKKGWQNGT